MKVLVKRVKEKDKYACHQALCYFSFQVTKMNEISGENSFVSTALT